jgi:UDP-N-acetylglucosamine 3-dehydrogenase
LKVGVIGLGAMGKNHARVLSNMSSIDELVLYDPLGKDIGALHGKPVNDNLESFLDQEFDYCVVSSPTSTHRDMALKLASLDVPALIEKPLASSVDEALEISEAFESRGLLGAVGHIERYNPAIIALRGKLSSGMLGKVFQITTRRVGPYSGRIRDVGVVKDLATHDIDLVLSISSSSYKSIHAKLSFPFDSGHEDSLLAIGELDSGVQFSHVVNWISPTKERLTTVLGENGLMVANTLTGELALFENGESVNIWDSKEVLRGVSEGAVHKIPVAKIEPLIQEHEVFQHGLSNNSRLHLVSISQGLEVLRVAERILRNPLSTCRPDWTRRV